jgi:RHS repeat-associated protein
VEYGQTIAYGQSTTLNPALVTAHSQGISGLAAGTLYHYRVKSRDAAGNLAVSGDFTFTTAQNGSAVIKWLVTDHLGSTRMVIDVTGSLAGIKRRDFLPFGEDLGAGIGIRSAALGYGADSTRQKFTGKERDDETGLDYFLARYHSPVQGRLTSVDPENAGADPELPQTWNGYSYAINNPLTYSDPDGQKVKICDTNGNCTDISDEDARKYFFNKNYQKQVGYSVDRGKVYDSNNNLIGTYQNICCDSLPARNAAIINYTGVVLSEPRVWVGGAVSVGVGAVIGGVLGSRGGSNSSVRPKLSTAEMYGTLRETAKKKGNFGIGAATRQEAQLMGEAWVGPGHKVASDGKTLISADGLRQYRPPSNKPKLGKEQANFEWRSTPGGRWTGNGHLDIQ